MSRRASYAQLRGVIQFLTDLADQAVLLPVALTVALGIWLEGWRRGAVAWMVAVAGTVGLMGALKLAFFACGGKIPWAGLTSPSGHTAIAALEFGGLAVLMSRVPVGARAVALISAVFAAVFGLTRLALEVHTVPDVLVGGVVGVAGALAFWRMAGPKPAGLGWRRFLAAIAVVALVFHGHRVAAETRLHWLALHVWPLTACVASPISAPQPDSGGH